MGLKKTVDLPNGLHVEGAYHVVTFARTNRANETDFTLGVFVDKEHANNPEYEITTMNGRCLTFCGEGALDIKAQIYAAVKLMPEFADAEDC